MLEFDMHTNLAKTLLTACALVTGVLASALAHAGARGQAPVAISAPAHTGPRDGHAFAAPGRQGLSACASRNFDPFQDGMRKGPRDPFADGGHTGPRDPFGEGARGTQADPNSSGAECLSALPGEIGSGLGSGLGSGPASASAVAIAAAA
ncbi:hypothetical protein CS8_051880 [Cupriavidus sp. 8B]